MTYSPSKDIASLGTAANGLPSTRPETSNSIKDGSPLISKLRNLLVSGLNVSMKISLFSNICSGLTFAIEAVEPSGELTVVPFGEGSGMQRSSRLAADK